MNAQTPSGLLKFALFFCRRKTYWDYEEGMIVVFKRLFGVTVILEMRKMSALHRMQYQINKMASEGPQISQKEAADYLNSTMREWFDEGFIVPKKFLVPRGED